MKLKLMRKLKEDYRSGEAPIPSRLLLGEASANIEMTL